MAKPLASQGENKKNVIKLLIVDDIPETRDNLKKLLAFEPDIDVIGTAGTGREALELVQEFTPDIILMDINMPDMDGIAATRVIRKSVPTSAVIMVSVQNELDYINRALLAGARYFLTKPVSGDELTQAIHQVFDLAQRMQAEAISEVLSRSLPNVDKTHVIGDVFISYSRKDWLQYVSPLIDYLRQRNIGVWVDQHLLEGGEDWLDTINNALEKCKIMLLCVSPDLVDSKYVKMEYRYFMQENKPVIPIICKEAKLPVELRGIQHIPHSDLDALYRRLKKLEEQS